MKKDFQATCNIQAELEFKLKKSHYKDRPNDYLYEVSEQKIDTDFNLIISGQNNNNSNIDTFLKLRETIIVRNEEGFDIYFKGERGDNKDTFKLKGGTWNDIDEGKYVELELIERKENDESTNNFVNSFKEAVLKQGITPQIDNFNKMIISSRYFFFEKKLFMSRSSIINFDGKLVKKSSCIVM